MDTERNVVNVREAAAILSEKAGRPISQDYVRELRRHKRLRAINEVEGEQTKAYLFWRKDIEQIVVGAKRIRGVHNPRRKPLPVEPAS